MSHIGVIDIGKTNAKFAVVDADSLREIAVRTRPNTVLGGPPYPHFDIEGIWTFLKASIAELNSQYPLSSLSITTHGAACALVDAEGQLVLPILDYEFEGPAAEKAAFEAMCPPFSVTLSPHLSGGLNLGAQLYYQQSHWPQAFAKTASILLYPQYWAFRLTATPASELTSLGCHTMLWDFERRDLSALVDRLGIRDKIPPLRSAFDTLGAVKPQLAEELGLAAPIPVFCGIHDSNASLLPHLLGSEPPFSVVSTGTWVVVCSPGGTVESLDEARDSLANMDAMGRTVPSARFMGGREYSRLMEGATPHPSPELVAEVLDGAMMLLPTVQYGSGPFPHHRSRWHGIANLDDVAQRQAIVSFYLALMTAECLALTGARGPVIVEGPFAGNRLYLEMLCAATGRSVAVNTGNTTGTSIGAALLAKGSAADPALRYQTLTDADIPSAMTNYARLWREIVSQSDAS